jgi:decaprenylphospho-beta-D-erythro-pentofuranosid-2-ulose 2-reductase
MRNAVGAVQSVLVLGGTSEIAMATVDALAARGCTRVVLAARAVDDLDAAEDRARAAGATSVERLPFDAADTAGHDACLDAAFAGGDLDCVIVAFGVLGDQDHFDAEPDDAVAAVEVNYVGAVSVGLRVAARLRAQGHGTIVVLSSVAGERVRAANFVYGSSKAGLDGFALGLGDALWGSGVRVMVVRPGFVATRMTEGMDPAPLSTTPEAVATDIVRGLERGAEIVWSPRPLRVVFSGFRHLPRAVFRKLPV